MKKRSYCTRHKSQFFDVAYRLRHEEGKSYPTIAKIIGVNASTISRWLSNFADKDNNCKQKTMEQNQEELNSTKLEEPKSINLEELANCSPEEQIAKLKVALSEAETRAKREGIRADLNEEIIKIAESKFNIQIRKKAGAKQ